MITPAIKHRPRKEEVISLLKLRAQYKATVIGADEVAEWQEGLLDELVEERWLAKIEPARVIACDGCHDDHVEEVILLVEPPGSPARAYVPCPENGRTRVPLKRLERWEINVRKVDEAIEAAEEARKGITPAPVWPDPTESTTGKIWELKDGTICFSTKTLGRKSEIVRFERTLGGRLTLQSKLMQLLSQQFERPLNVSEILQQLYPEEMKAVRSDPSRFWSVLNRLQSVVSAIREKLSSAGMNPEVLPAISRCSDYQPQKERLALQLAHLRNLGMLEFDSTEPE